MRLSPSQTQVAQQLFIAKEYLDFVAQEFETMEEKILRTGTYHYDEDHYTHQDCDLPQDRIIRDRKDLFLISGLKFLDNPKYIGTDADKYYSELRNRSLSAGFIDGENARAIAEDDVRKLESKLISLTHNIHKIPLEKIVVLKHRKELIDTLLILFKPVKSDKNYVKLSNNYFDLRINLNIQSQYLDGQLVEALCYDSKEKRNKWQKGTVIKTVPANDRPFRIEVRLDNGILYANDNAVSIECLRPI